MVKNPSFLPHFGANDNKEFSQLNGIFVLNKPAGPSSSQCLAAFKRLNQKKIGHGGTLDPFAEGVLLILLGQATKLSSFLLEGGKKVYRGVICLGIETDTWDCNGNVVASNDADKVSVGDIEKELSELKISKEQEIPAYSAIHHNGQPLYKLARKGIATPKKIKPVNIYRISVLDYHNPYIEIQVECGSGTYIRSLAHSLGKRLGCGAMLQKLVREYSHPFAIGESSSFEELKADPQILPKKVRPLTEGLPLWPKIFLSDNQAKDAKNGKPLLINENGQDIGWTAGKVECPDKKAFFMYQNQPLALAALKNGKWHILRGLWD